MRTLSADWMANTSKPETEMQSYPHSGEESRGTFFYPRPVAPTSAQVSLLIFSDDLGFQCCTLQVQILIIVKIHDKHK